LDEKELPLYHVLGNVLPTCILFNIQHNITRLFQNDKCLKVQKLRNPVLNS